MNVVTRNEYKIFQEVKQNFAPSFIFVWTGGRNKLGDCFLLFAFYYFFFSCELNSYRKDRSVKIEMVAIVEEVVMCIGWGERHTTTSFLSSNILFLSMYFPKKLLSLNHNIFSACPRKFEAYRLPSAVVSELTSVFGICEMFLQASSTLSNCLQLNWKLPLLEFQKIQCKKLFLLLKKTSSNFFPNRKALCTLRKHCFVWKYREILKLIFTFPHTVGEREVAQCPIYRLKSIRTDYVVYK